MKAAKLAVICFMVGCIFSAQGINTIIIHMVRECFLWFMIKTNGRLSSFYRLEIFLALSISPKQLSKKQTIKQTLAQLANSQQLVTFNGECKLTQANFEKPFEHHTHDSHQDLEVEYSFNCDKPVSKVTVTLFAWAEAISVIEAQWITEQAQGIAELTATKPYIEWPL